MFATEVIKALKQAGIEAKEEELETPPDPKFGDIAYPCFGLAKVLGKNPNEVAKEIVSKIQVNEKSPFSSIEVAGPYINFFIDWERVAPKLLKNILSKNFGIGKKKKKKIMVEHTSVNPNKAIHIGHTRNSCLGDSLAKILKFVGNDVIVVNYIDDTGAQVADAIVGLKFLKFPIKTKKKFDHYIGDDVYVKVTQLYEKMPELAEQRRIVLQQIEEGDNEIAKFTEEIVNKILLAQLETCWRLNIFYDLLNRESDIIRLKFWEHAFEILKEKNLVYKPEVGDRAGTWLLRLSQLPEFKGIENPDITLVRSDGTALYVGKDIAYAMWKHGLLGKDFHYVKFTTQPNKKILWVTSSTKGLKNHPKFNNVDESINVIDVRQSYEQSAVISALKLISGKEMEYKYYGYEIVALSAKTAEQLGIPVAEGQQMVHMSGRKGHYINTDVVLNKLFTKALDETKKRNPKEKEEVVKQIAEKVAVAALRYELTKISPEKILVFDLDEAIKLEGNTGPYLQYAYTRCAGILRKAESWKQFFEEVERLTPQEKKLLQQLSRFPEIIQKAANELRPHIICNYAYELATTVNNFYEFVPVLKEENEKLKNFRLTLVKATKEVLRITLNLIGIEVLEKM
jgi:arginyl-tRNA synthetase